MHTLLVQVTIFSGLTVTLGNLMDYFTSVNTELITQCIISVESSDGIGSGYQTNVSASSMAPKLLQTTIPLSSSYAYLYAIGKNSFALYHNISLRKAVRVLATTTIYCVVHVGRGIQEFLTNTPSW